MKSLVHIKDILIAATNLGMDNKNNAMVIDRHYNDNCKIVEYNLVELSRDQEGIQQIYNNFLIYNVSNTIKSPYLEGFVGTYRSTSQFWYLTTKRDMSFERINELFKKDENITT
jgi:hypothetical protein